MKILAQFDNSREGNDCWLYEQWFKVEIFGRIVYLWARKLNDWNPGPTFLEVGETSMTLGYPEIKARLDV